MSPPKCPVGETSCEWLDEVGNLRSQINELSELVSTDALTGLFNFRHFKMVLQVEMDRSRRSGNPTSLVMVDIDHFKAVNDTRGHELGNVAIKFITDILRSSVRPTDMVCRYGGEEFAMIFPETQLSFAVKVADRIREKIANRPLETDDGDIALTVSMGASAFVQSNVLDPNEFVASVDKYLYEAKQSGRNCICHSDYSEPSSIIEVSVDERAMLLNPE